MQSRLQPYFTGSSLTNYHPLPILDSSCSYSLVGSSTAVRSFRSDVLALKSWSRDCKWPINAAGRFLWLDALLTFHAVCKCMEKQMSSSSRTSGFSATPLPGMSAQDDSGTAHGHVDSGRVADLAVRPRAKRTPDFVPQKSRRLPPYYVLQHFVQMCAFIVNSSLHHYLVAIKLVSI